MLLALKSEGGHHLSQASLLPQLPIVYMKQDASSASQHGTAKHVSKDVYVVFLLFKGVALSAAGDRG